MLLRSLLGCENAGKPVSKKGTEVGIAYCLLNEQKKKVWRWKDGFWVTVTSRDRTFITLMRKALKHHRNISKEESWASLLKTPDGNSFYASRSLRGNSQTAAIFNWFKSDTKGKQIPYSLNICFCFIPPLPPPSISNVQRYLDVVKAFQVILLGTASTKTH